MIYLLGRFFYQTGRSRYNERVASRWALVDSGSYGGGISNMRFPRYRLHRELSIETIISFSYRQLPKQYFSVGESHDFWEFAYIDQGQVEVFTDIGRYDLNQGDIIFYKPNLFHVGKTNPEDSPVLVNLSFECDAACMSFFPHHHFRLEQHELQLLTNLVKIGTEAFDPPVDSARMRFPNRWEGAKFGTEQLIINYLEIFLLELIRNGERRSDHAKPASVMKDNQQTSEVLKLIEYMTRHIAAEDLSIDELCNQFAIGRTQLKTKFKAQTGYGIMEYWRLMKIEHAKRMIADEQYNFTEIAECLGYNNVHSFSRQFKNMTGMTPSDYSRTIDVRFVTGKPFFRFTRDD
ncbi:helix-turn-helix domain-containing protein [Paenibacillus mesophilus]|nr:helix-turn-helix domain-containing protein [Paenibacillus mesophilus]